jgi:hypothetical protein
MQVAQTELAVEDLISRQTHGWLAPYLLEYDTYHKSFDEDFQTAGKPKGVRYHFDGTHRWDYWLSACLEHKVPKGAIPQIHWQDRPDPIDEKEIQNVLTHYVQRGLGSYSDAWMALVRWLLWGLGYKGELLDTVQRGFERIPDEVRALWYREFSLANLLHSHIDWSAYILQNGLPETRGRNGHRYESTGYFSTPMALVKMMFGLLVEPDVDHRFESICEPCAGTGSVLLVASNYSLNLYGQEKVADLVLCSILNGYLFVPWLVYMPDYMREILDAKRTPRKVPIVLPSFDQIDISELEQLTLPMGD